MPSTKRWWWHESGWLALSRLLLSRYYTKWSIPEPVVCLQRDFLKQCAWVVFYPMPHCCWFCSAAGPACVITWKNLIPATFYTAWGNPILLMELHFILGREVIRAGTSWKDNGISSGLVGMLLVGMEHALGASKRKKRREQNLTWTLALAVTSLHILWFCPLDFPFSWARSPFPVSRSRFNVLVTPGHVGFLWLTCVLLKNNTETSFLFYHRKIHS